MSPALIIGLSVLAIYLAVGAVIGWYALGMGWKHSHPPLKYTIEQLCRWEGFLVFAFFTFLWLPFFCWARYVTWSEHKKQVKALAEFRDANP